MPSVLKESSLRALGEKHLSNKGLSSYGASGELLKESKAHLSGKAYDIFLSHRTSDAKLVYGVKARIEASGLTVFVYWIENPGSTSEPVTRSVADRLRSQMKSCRSLLYVDSENATHSKWMPWELGYIDGLRNKVAILPTTSSGYTKESYVGQEYLGIYPWVGESALHQLYVYDQGNSTSLLKDWIGK